MDPAAKAAAIRACGVSDVEMVEFTSETAAMAPEEFAERFLARPGCARPKIVCGGNWRFGAGGRGDPSLLCAMGFDVEVVPYLVHDGLPVSSSRIRACLMAGDVAAANAMLGRVHSLVGEVFRGKGMGSRIGFPTVNVRLGAECSASLARGVYEVQAWGLTAVANLGVAPTLDERAWDEPVLEMHFPGLAARDLSAVPGDGGAVEVSFVRFIRPERKFGSVEELVRRIAADCALVRHA